MDGLWQPEPAWLLAAAILPAQCSLSFPLES